MTATNPHPLANPLNQSRFRNYEYGQQQIQQTKEFVKNTLNPKKLTVPDSTPYEQILAKQNTAKNLTVPNSDIPYYDRPIPVSGFLGNSSLLKLSDGCILDLKKCKIVYDPNIKWKAQGYWNDSNSAIKKQNDKEWGKTETIESLLNSIGKPIDMNNDPNLSPESIRYWKKAQEESQKLEQNLTDEQKKLLDTLNSGQMFPLSKLIDEQ